MDRTLTASTTKKRGKSVGSLAVHVINLLLTAHTGNTVLDTCTHGCAVRAYIGRYCPGAWSIMRTSMYQVHVVQCDNYAFKIAQGNRVSTHSMPYGS